MVTTLMHTTQPARVRSAAPTAAPTAYAGMWHAGSTCTNGLATGNVFASPKTAPFGSNEQITCPTRPLGTRST